MERYVSKTIQVSALSRATSYACRYRFQDAVLEKSIDARGVLQPLIVHDSLVICGHKRFFSAVKLGLKEIPVFELGGAFETQDLFWMSLLSNWNQAWNDLDRAWAIRLAVEKYGIVPQIITGEVLPCLGLEPKEHFIKEYLDVANLEPAILDRIASGNLPFRGSQILGRFSVGDRIVFANQVASKIHLTTNQLLKAGEWLCDLMGLARKNLSDYLASWGLLEILDHDKWEPRQKAERFLAALRALRLPRLVEQEKKFARAAAAFAEESREIKVEAPAFFEGEGVVLQARIRRPEFIEPVLGEILAKREALNSLFDILL